MIQEEELLLLPGPYIHGSLRGTVFAVVQLNHGMHEICS